MPSSIPIRRRTALVHPNGGGDCDQVHGSRRSKSDFLGHELLISVERQAGGCRNSVAVQGAWRQQEHQRAEPMKAGRRKGRKVGKPRGKTCQWTAELDDVLKTAWARGGLRAAGGLSGSTNQRGPGIRSRNARRRWICAGQERRAGRTRMRTTCSGPSTAMHRWH